MHEIKSGPFQTVLIDSQWAQDKYDGTLPSNTTLGSNNHFEVKVFQNYDILGENSPLQTFTLADLDRRFDTVSLELYSDNVKCNVLEEAVDFIEGMICVDDLKSNLPDHSILVHIMSASYTSHIRRKTGLRPVVPIKILCSAGTIAHIIIHN
jgi:hypothetical protein